MNENPQKLYERRLKQYVRMIHGAEGLIAKLTVFRELVARHRDLGDDLWKIDPLLYFFARSMQTEVILDIARLLENKDRSNGNIEKFLNFCIANSGRIYWGGGLIPQDTLFQHKTILASHSAIIASIKGRRDKVIAHLDRRYFYEPELVEEDYPIDDQDLIDLANGIIKIFRDHEIGLHPECVSFHLSEFYQIAVDNMIRNLKTGREQNFGVAFEVSDHD